MATETKNNIHEGKWGFYPCDYQMYQKIRRLYGYYLLALRRAAERPLRRSVARTVMMHTTTSSSRSVKPEERRARMGPRFLSPG